MRFAASRPDVTAPSIQPYQLLDTSPPAKTTGGGISARGENPSNKARGEMSLASACLQRLQQSIGTLPDLQMLISEGRGNRRQQLVLVRRNLVVATAHRV